MDPLLQRDLLLTIAEVAAAFVGFSMIVAALRSQPSGGDARFHSVRDVAEIGLYVVAAAFLPLIIHSFGVGAELTWRASSAAFVAVWLLGFTFAQLRFRRGGAGFVLVRTWPFWGAVSAILTTTGNVLLLWNLTSPTALAGPRYVTALALLLAIAGGLFINATFRERQA